METTIDAEIAYGVSGGTGGPWTMSSDGNAPFIWTGYENAGDPLRKALSIEVDTDQEGGSIEGSGDQTFEVSALDHFPALDRAAS